MKTLKLRTNTNSRDVIVFLDQITAILDSDNAINRRGTTIFLTGGTEIVVQESIPTILKMIKDFDKIVM